MKTKNIILNIFFFFFFYNIAQAELTELFQAISSNDFEKVEKLVQEDKSIVNQSDKSGKTPLMAVATNNYGEKITLYLLENKAHIEARNQDGLSAIEIAAKNNNIPVFDILVNLGADISNIDVSKLDLKSFPPTSRTIQVLRRGSEMLKRSKQAGFVRFGR